MLAINPLLPFFPDSISFLIYGLVTGLLLKFWKIARRNFFFILAFLYAYLVWLASMALLMTVQSQTRQAWFIFGFALTFIKIFSIIRTILFSPFTWAFETITEGIQERRADRRDQQRREQRERENQSYQERNQQQFREEQARREAEAKANRGRTGQTEQASENTQSQNQKTNQSRKEKVEDKRQQKQEEPQDIIKPAEQKRSYEEILGLSAGWTQEDLKTAYKREAQRTHPDKWIGKPESLRKIMEAEYKAVQEAYKKLKSI